MRIKSKIFDVGLLKGGTDGLLILRLPLLTSVKQNLKIVRRVTVFSARKSKKTTKTCSECNVT
jgi:hypothetical protein